MINCINVSLKVGCRNFAKSHGRCIVLFYKYQCRQQPREVCSFDSVSHFNVFLLLVFLIIFVIFVIFVTIVFSFLHPTLLTDERYIKNPNTDQTCLLDTPIKTVEDIGFNHWIDHLPGNNPVSYGPAAATPLSGAYHNTFLQKSLTIIIIFDGHIYAQKIGTTLRVLLKSVRNGLYVTSISSRPNTYLTADATADALSYPQVWLSLLCSVMDLNI